MQVIVNHEDTVPVPVKGMGMGVGGGDVSALSFFGIGKESILSVGLVMYLF